MNIILHIGFIKDIYYKTMTKQEYLDNLDKQDLLCIIKHGLRGSNAPEDVNVEDIYYLIGCFYIADIM